ncbi:FAD-dependent oxidoreductase [Caproiciproducens sp. NJN-50]|uniref:NAD(P)/FAD-dependent oxidoreductase n=1 Tax=Caproiciproducens sp. NJN-50 TaxID=2507162 RepID=UPI000FFE0137|nr:NAD(P)/FAD-dependent oxidoreductase [Caproiciproducens sp. NJN-50]QAT48944.1 FAD-dependent oxidoreductase [Caproiciproducens sp. NJN-50]
MEGCSFPVLFSPLKIKNLTIQNRTVMMPMGTNFACADGSISREHMRYYIQRARGGTGLIIVENANVSFPAGSNGTTQLRLDEDRFIPGFFELCEALHAQGCAVSIQLNHAGASARSSRIGMQPVSASSRPSKRGNEIPRPLTVEEIQKIVKDFGAAAKRAQIAGFDSVEIHGGHSYLLSQFLSPTTNGRTDQYGGTPENRARFLREAAEEIRSQVGPNFPVMLRLSADEFVPGGNTLDDTLEYLKYVAGLVDVFNVSCGLNDSLEYQIDSCFRPDGWRSYMARAVRDRFGKPTITMGNIRDPHVAEDILERGDADLIGLGRCLIADPDWAWKAKNGKKDEIRKCISCNIGCAGNRIGKNRPLRCTVNPAVVEGDAYRSRKVSRPCNVVVAGGGTAGLEAACTAAEVGCTVSLLEQSDHLGGHTTDLVRLPDKARIGDFTAYLIRRASNLKNLTVLLNTPASTGKIRDLRPDVIVNATGSVPVLPNIPGLRETTDQEGSPIHTVFSMIDHVDSYPADMTGKKVVIAGGGAVGLDMMEFFAQRGAEVTVVELLPALGSDLDPITKVCDSNMMEKYKVRQLTGTRLLEVRKTQFLVETDGKQSALPLDYGFICLGMRPYAPVLDGLRSDFSGSVEILNIGDSLKAGQIISGVQAGRNVLLTLERLGFLAPDHT